MVQIEKSHWLLGGLIIKKCAILKLCISMMKYYNGFRMFEALQLKLLNQKIHDQMKMYSNAVRLYDLAGCQLCKGPGMAENSSQQSTFNWPIFWPKFARVCSNR